MIKKRFIILFLTLILFSPSFIFAETVVLKSGKTLQGKIVEKADKYIKINVEDAGIPLTYFFEDIKSIDGQEFNKATETSQISSGKPTIQEIEPVLKDYLVAEQAVCCPGGVTVEELSNIRIGDYDNELGGWPVYSKDKIICRQGKGTITIDGTKHKENVITAVVRRTNLGDVECFMPEIFKQGLAQFDLLLKEASVKMQKDFEEEKKKAELLKKEARSKEEIKEGFVKQVVQFADGRGNLGNFNIAGLTIWVDVQTVFEGIDSFAKLKGNECVAVAYYIFGNSKIAKRVRVLKSPDEFSEAFQKEYASLPFSLSAEKVNEAITYFKDLGRDKQVSSLGKLDINAFDLGTDIGYVKIFTPFAAIAEMAAYARNNSKEPSYEYAERIKYKPTELYIYLFLNKEEKKILDSVKCLLKIKNETIDLKSSGRSFSCDKSKPNSCKGGIAYELPSDKITNLAECTLIIEHPLRGELSVKIDLTKVK